VIDQDLAAIKAALEAGPTPGPWIEAGPSYGKPLPVAYTSVVQDLDDDDDAPSICRDTMDADASYIAAVSPDRIARIVAELERLRAKDAG
jgi:hypothetical protein